MATTHPPSIANWGQASHSGAPSIATNRRADSIGASGRASLIWGSTQGNMDVGKKVPATNIMGRAMALPIPDAAAGVRAQADRMNPMFRNTRLASGTTAKIQRGFPCILAPNTNTPTATITTA